MLRRESLRGLWDPSVMKQRAPLFSPFFCVRVGRFASLCGSDSGVHALKQVQTAARAFSLATPLT
jgi:hypothetical protein